MTVARPRGRGRNDDALLVGRSGNIRSLGGRVQADNMRVHCYPSKEFNGTNDILGNVSDAVRVVDINALSPDTDFNHPGPVGYFLAVNAGFYESQNNSALMSGGIHVGGVYSFKDTGSLVGSQYESVYYITNTPGYDIDLPTTASFGSGAIYRAQGTNTVTVTADANDINSAVVATTDGSSTLTATRIVNFNAGVLVGTGATVTERFGLRVVDVPSSNLGTVTTQVGVEIPVLKFATTNHAIRVGYSTTTTSLVASPAAAVRLWPSTYTADFASASFPHMIDVLGTFQYKQNAVALLSFPGMWWAPTVKNEATTSSSLGNTVAVYASATHTADTNAISGGKVIDVLSQTSFTTTGGGSFTDASAVSLQSQMVVGAGAVVTERYGLNYIDKTGAGTLTTQYAVYIPALSGASTNIGISNAASLVQSGVSTFTGGLTITDVDVALSTSTGTKFGTATTQKLAFYNSTPIVRPDAVTDLGTVLSNLGLRASGTAYPITTSGAVAFSGTVGMQADVTILGSNKSYASAPLPILGVPSSVTVTTATGNNLLPSLLADASTRTLAVAGTTNAAPGIDLNSTVKGTVNFATSGVTGTGWGVRDRTTLTADTNAITFGVYTSYRANVTANVVSGGTFTGGILNGYVSAPTVGTGVTLASVIHYSVTDVANTGTITTQTAINIPALSGATTNVGISNAASLAQSGASTFTGTVNITDVNVVLGTSTGTKFGTATTQKLGFFNATPIVQGTAFTQTYSTATHTHANITASNPPAGGTGATAGAYDTAGHRDSMITSLTANIADVANVKQVLNGLIDDLQALGLVG